jgi:hypothetical protein
VKRVQLSERQLRHLRFYRLDLADRRLVKWLGGLTETERKALFRLGLIEWSRPDPNEGRRWLVITEAGIAAEACGYVENPPPGPSVVNVLHQLEKGPAKPPKPARVGRKHGRPWAAFLAAQKLGLIAVERQGAGVSDTVFRLTEAGEKMLAQQRAREATP